MAKKLKTPKRRSFEAMSLRAHKPKVIPDKRFKRVKISVRDLNHD